MAAELAASAWPHACSHAPRGSSGREVEAAPKLPAPARMARSTTAAALSQQTTALEAHDDGLESPEAYPLLPLSS